MFRYVVTTCHSCGVGSELLIECVFPQSPDVASPRFAAAMLRIGIGLSHVVVKVPTPSFSLGGGQEERKAIKFGTLEATLHDHLLCGSAPGTDSVRAETLLRSHFYFL